MTALGFGILGYLLAYKSGQFFREGLFQFVTSFSLPWYTIAGAQKGVSVGLPIAGVLALGDRPDCWPLVRGCQLRRLSKHFVRGEWFMVIALMTGVVWIISDALGASTWLAAGDRVRLRLYVPGDRALPRVGGAAGQGAEGRLPARRRSSDAGSQDQGQVTGELRSLGLVVEHDDLQVNPKLTVADGHD